MDLAHCGCANEDIRPSRMNPERESQLTIPTTRARIDGLRAVRPAISLKKPGLSSGAFNAKSYGEFTFDFATHACSPRLSIWTGEAIPATLHNSYAVKADHDPFESASAVSVNARVIALSAVESR